jgi:hypothetical protein
MGIRVAMLNPFWGDAHPAVVVVDPTGVWYIFSACACRIRTVFGVG